MEWLSYFKANNIISLSLDNIYLKDISSDTNNKNEHPINLDVRLVYNTEDTYL